MEPFGLDKEPLHQSIDDIQNLFLEQEATVAYGDEYLAACAGAFGQLIVSHEYIRDKIGDIAFERRATPPYMVNLMTRAIQKQSMDDPEYPYASKEKWMDEIVTRLTDKERWTEFWFDVRVRSIQSNVAERYKAFKLLGKMYEDRFPEGISMLDVGCSQNIGLNKLGHGLDFNQLLEVSTVSDEASDPVLKKQVNMMLRDTMELRHGIGIDIFSPKDPDIAQWARACSFRPKELLDHEKLATYDELTSMPWADQVGFVWQDFAVNGLALPDQHASSTFDMIVFPTILYQIMPDDREVMFQNALRHVSPNGLIVVQDAVRSSDSVDTVTSPMEQLEFHEEDFASRFGYGTYILDMTESEKGFQPVFRWDNGRCNSVILGNLALQKLKLAA